jgi:hypothetical protein
MAGKDGIASDFAQTCSLIDFCADANTQTNTDGADLLNDADNSKFELNLNFPTKLTSDVRRFGKHVASGHG